MTRTSDPKRMPRTFKLSMVLGSIAVLTFSAGGKAFSESAQEIVSPEGCAMAHCDQALSDSMQLQPPLSDGVVEAWRDRTVFGSYLGMGCVSNTHTVVCSFRSTTGSPIELRAYDPEGNTRWSSTALSGTAFYSAPMIDPGGGVIAVDDSRIIRLDPSGETVWSRPTAGGRPFSPNVTDTGEIILAASGGPVSAYDYTTGDLLTQLRLDATLRIGGVLRTGYFDTINSTAIRGNRLYISTRFVSNGQTTNSGRLYALDLVRDTGGSYRFEIAWFVGFRAPSGASPTLSTDGQGRALVFFDGSGITPAQGRNPQAFAVRDLGTSGEILWRHPLPIVPQMSPALDPRGGIWFFSPRSTDIIRLSEIDGQPVQVLDVDDIVDSPAGTFLPFTVMTISGDATAPVMMVGATTSDFSITYVIAIDLNSGGLLWKFRVDEGQGFYGMPSGQYPTLLNGSGEPIVVFSTRGNGVWALTDRP